MKYAQNMQNIDEHIEPASLNGCPHGQYSFCTYTDTRTRGDDDIEVP